MAVGSQGGAGTSRSADPNRRGDAARGEHHARHHTGQPGRSHEEELEGFDGSDDATTAEDESCDSDSDEEDPWTEQVKEECIEDFYAYVSRAAECSCVGEGSPLLKLQHCRYCFSSKVKPVHSAVSSGRRVLLVSPTKTEAVTVPFFCCDAASDVQTPECSRGAQHVSLLSIGYFPSTIVQTRDLTQQRHSGTLVFFHVELLKGFHCLHLHAPGLSTQAWADHYIEAFGFGDIRARRIEDLMGKTAERFRDLMHAVSRMERYGISNYPGQVPLFGSCPVCSELTDPIANGFEGAKVDLQMDACMGLVHYKETARVMNAARTRPLVAEVRSFLASRV